jgi:GNAT superfamily N-acetyltransferase
MRQQRRSIFASTEMAARIERAEADFMVRCVAPIVDEPDTAQNFAIAIGSGFATFGGATSPFTKIVGVGFGELPTREQIVDIENRITGAGGTVQFEISQLAEPGLAEDLTSRGYRLISFENVLGRALSIDDMADTDAPDNIRIDRAEARAQEWMDVVVRGALAPDTVGIVQHESFPAEEIVRAEEAGVRAGCRIYLATIDGEPVGGGGLRVFDGIAQFTGAATVPESRRRGVQSALLRVRLRDAAREGCDLAVVTTQPGSVSQANMQKFGFDLLYTRAVLVAPSSEAAYDAAASPDGAKSTTRV